MNPPPARVAIIGLDGVPPELLFDQLLDQLPNLAGLKAAGRWGPLTSSIPPITVPAWACLASGLDPGQLGLYGFRNRADHGYGDLALASARDLAAPCLWDLAGEAGLSSVVLGLPLTYPPRPLKGAMVAGPLTPNKEAAFTYPRSLRPMLDQWAQGDYLIDLTGFRQMERAELARQAQLMAARRFLVARRLYRRYEPHLLIMVEMGPDRMHHAFWRFQDPDHRLHQAHSPHGQALAQHYRGLDQHLGRLLAELAPGTLVLVVSDHGARSMAGGLAINEWLISQGFLRLLRRPEGPGPLDPELVDWPGTRAWSSGGYYARIFLNLAGREPQGTLAPHQAQSFKAELTRRLEQMPGPDGRPLGNQVFDPQHIYHQVRGVPPDLILYPGGLAWRAVGSVQPQDKPPLFVYENDTGPDDANHSQQGVVIAARLGGPALPRAGQPLGPASIYDVAPTVLSWLGLPRPEAMQGQAWDLGQANGSAGGAASR